MFVRTLANKECGLGLYLAWPRIGALLYLKKDRSSHPPRKEEEEGKFLITGCRADSPLIQGNGGSVSGLGGGPLIRGWQL